MAAKSEQIVFLISYRERFLWLLRLDRTCKLLAVGSSICRSHVHFGADGKLIWQPCADSSLGNCVVWSIATLMILRFFRPRCRTHVFPTQNVEHVAYKSSPQGSENRDLFFFFSSFICFLSVSSFLAEKSYTALLKRNQLLMLCLSTQFSCELELCLG